MLEPISILASLKQIYSPAQLHNYKVVITAGPTYETIDPVRYIANHSSGKMGYALARVFADAGAEVILVSGPCHLEPPRGIRFIAVNTAEEMKKAVLEQVVHADIFIAAAAVADYRVENPASQKIKKNETRLQLHLIKNPDILQTVSALSERPFTVGFAAETDDLIENATKKLHEKNVDLIIANQIKDQFPFNAEDNEIWILSKNKEPLHFPRMPKLTVAEKIKNQIISEITIHKKRNTTVSI